MTYETEQKVKYSNVFRVGCILGDGGILVKDYADHVDSELIHEKQKYWEQFTKLNSVINAPDGEPMCQPFALSGLLYYFDKEIIPDCMGVYWLVKNDRIVYIGMARNLRKRLLYHYKNKHKETAIAFDSVSWFPSWMHAEEETVEQTLKLEKVMIQHHIPALNMKHLSSGQ
jgi:predicted GIY-YIG superfamily endonuclease